MSAVVLIVFFIFTLVLPFQLAFKPYGYRTNRILSFSMLKSLSFEEVLSGKNRDLAAVEYALESMLVCDPSFTTRPNSLSKVISALDTCRAEGLVLLHWWKRLTIEGRTPVNAKAVRSLVAQIHSRAKEDHQALSTLIQVVSALDDSLVVGDTSTVMLLYKILFLLGNTTQAMEYFLKAARFSPDTVERGAIVMISEFGKLSKLDLVDRVFDVYSQTVGAVGENRTILFNTYLQTQLLNGNEKKALEFFKFMLMEKCVNDVSIAQLLSYFSGKDDMSLCRDLWAQMIENKISPGPISRALFFRTLATTGNLDEAKRTLLKDASEKEKDILLSLYMHKLGLSRTQTSAVFGIIQECSGMPKGDLQLFHQYPDSIASLFRGYMTSNFHKNVIEFYLRAQESSSLPSINMPESITEAIVSCPTPVFVLLLAAAKDRIERAGRNHKQSYKQSAEVVLYEHLKNVTFRRLDVHKSLIDEVTLCSTMDLANSAGDFYTTSLLWKCFRNLRITYSSRAFHSYMRSFRRPQQIMKLEAVIRTFPYLGISLDMRTCDEIVNAHCRVGGLASALDSLGLVSFTSKQVGYSRRSRAISGSALTNLYIYFDKTWRNQFPERHLLNFSKKEELSTIMLHHSHLLIDQLRFERHVSDKAGYFGLYRTGWATICGAFLARNESLEASRVFVDAIKFLGTSEYAVLELSVLSALGESFPLLTSTAPQAYTFIDKKLNQIDVELMCNFSDSVKTPSISNLVNSLPGNYLLSTRDDRNYASLTTVVDFLETIVAHHSANLLPVRASFIAGLLMELLDKQLLAQAARVVRIMGGLSFRHSSENVELAEESKALLARKWVALLLGSSLNKKKSLVLTDALRILKSKRLGEV